MPIAPGLSGNPFAAQVAEWFPQPVDFTPWMQPRLRIIPPAGILTSCGGMSGVYGNVSGAGQGGMSRIQNNIEGYNIWIGAGTLPNLSQPPAAFSATLPASVAITLPVSGVQTYYVLVTRQDTYGLNSQNQFYTLIDVNSSGVLQLLPVTNPVNLTLIARYGSYLRVLASYTGFYTDESPATGWKIWAGVVPPNVHTDVPVAVLPAGTGLSVDLGPYAPGTIYVAVALFRQADGFLSGVLTGSYTFVASPPEPLAVPSGFDGP